MTRLDTTGGRNLPKGEAPDLAIEVLSPSSRTVDLKRKFQLYEEKGVREYWVVDPKERLFYFFVARKGKFKHVENEGVWDQSRVLPGLVLNLGEFWKKIG